MHRTRTLRLAALTASASLGTLLASTLPARGQGWGVVEKAGPGAATVLPTRPIPPTTVPRIDEAFRQAIERVVNMPFDSDLVTRASRHDLNVINVTWEDTGRYVGSALGPNISDLTLQVREQSFDGTRTHLLPVLRHPNFTDKTADIRADKLWVRVGNQTGTGRTVTVPLTEVLSNLKAYLSDPYGLAGDGNFLARRDTHFLVSAQHVFMPLPAQGKAEFTPVLYNYQSRPGSPAVLSLLVTRQGTSVTIIENFDGDQSYQQWGQQLFFNNKSQRTTFTAERRSAVKSRVDAGRATGQDEGALDPGADMVMLIQVPLKVTRRVPPPTPCCVAYEESADASVAAAPPQSKTAAAATTGNSRSQPSDVETAVIGHGEDRGQFSEIKGMRIERDPQFPVRVTVQFYKATSNGVVSDLDLAQAKAQIDKVYASGDFVGSLVVPQGERSRPTEWWRGRTPFRP